MEWIRTWTPHVKERLAEITRVLRRLPWTAEVIKQRPASNPSYRASAVYFVVIHMSTDRLILTYT